ncbi:MAG: hypothetical protein R2755_03170 [Acidimicrobiales bacterium]
MRSKGLRTWAPASTPMPRAVDCGRSRAPAPFCSAANAMMWRYCSIRCGNWKKANVSGRPLARDTSPIHCSSERACAHVSALSVSKRGTTSYTPRP